MSAPEDNFPPIDSPGDLPAEGAQSPDESLRPSPVQAPAAEAPPGVPEDLCTAWSWPDLILFALFFVGTNVVLPLLAGLAAILVWHIKPADIDKVPAIKAAVVIAGQALSSLATIVYLFGTVRMRSGRPFWQTIGWRALRPQRMTSGTAALACVLGGVGLAVAIQFSSQAVGKKSSLPIEELFQSRPTVLMLMALGILVAPLVEETIFRGYIYPVLARGLGIPVGIGVTGTLFGLMHAAQLWGGWGQIALIIVVGVVLTAVRARTGTVLASYLVHLGYNTMLFAEFYFATEGLRRFPGTP